MLPPRRDGRDSNPGVDTARFALRANRLVECLTSVPYVKLEIRQTAGGGGGSSRRIQSRDRINGNSVGTAAPGAQRAREGAREVKREARAEAASADRRRR